MKKLVSVALVSSALLSTVALAQQEVNVYSLRQPNLINPMLEAFTKDTGIKVNVLHLDKGLVEKLQAEGELSPADVILSVDIGRLKTVQEAGLSQSVDSDVINANIPARYRNGDWFALTSRARAIYSSKDRVGRIPANFSYLDLAKPKYKGRVCMRAADHVYNLALFSSLIAHYGEAQTKAFLEGLKANLARKAGGSDRDQIKAIAAGVCDYALGNSYYFGKMLTADKAQQDAADKVYINFPQGGYKTHMNISGMLLAKNSPNKANAIKLMEYLSGDKAQKMYAELNFEYPVKDGVQSSPIVSSWGRFSTDKLNLEDVVKYHSTAQRLVNEVNFAE